MPMRLLSVPHSLQLEDFGCLGACTQMVLRYLGKEYSQPVLNSTLGLTSIGTPFRNLQRLSRWGLHIDLKAGSDTEIRRVLDEETPPIIFLMTGDLPYWSANTSHAVVAIGYDDNVILLNDPMFDEAPQRVAWDAFLLAWSEHNYFFALITN